MKRFLYEIARVLWIALIVRVVCVFAAAFLTEYTGQPVDLEYTEGFFTAYLCFRGWRFLS